jgi:hypothetical protein
MTRPPPYDIPPDGTLCDVCRKRKVTGGTTYKYRGERIAINFCRECEYDLPFGASWRQLGLDSPTSPRDPAAICDRCGAIGTVGRVTRQSRTASVTRYCRACWPGVRQEVVAEGKSKEDRLRSAFERIHENPSAMEDFMTSFRREEAVICDSRDWRDTVEFLQLISPSLEEGAKDRSAANLVEDILAYESDMDGPMPPEVRAFIERYGPDA